MTLKVVNVILRMHVFEIQFMSLFYIFCFLCDLFVLLIIKLLDYLVLLFFSK